MKGEQEAAVAAVSAPRPARRPGPNRQTVRCCVEEQNRTEVLLRESQFKSQEITVQLCVLITGSDRTNHQD